MPGQSAHGTPRAHLRQGYGAAGGVAQAIVHRGESAGAYCSEAPAPRRVRGARASAPTRGPMGQGPRSHPPAEATRALAMDLVAVVEGLGVAGLGWQGLQVNGLRGPQRLQHGIEPLPRPLQQAAEARDGDPIRGRRQAVGGRPARLPEALWVQGPRELLVLVEPIASGRAQGGVACGRTAAMGRVPIEHAVQTLDQGGGQADADNTGVLRFWVRHSFPFVDTKHYTM